MWLCKQAVRDLRGIASDCAFSPAPGWGERGQQNTLYSQEFPRGSRNLELSVVLVLEKANPC